MGHRADATEGGLKRRGGGRADQTALALLRVLVVRGTLVRVESSCAVLDDWVALANGRARYPPWDLTECYSGVLPIRTLVLWIDETS